MNTKEEKTLPKKTFHPRNKHQGYYNFEQLIKIYPKLAAFVGVNEYDIETIDFSDAKAVKALNTALLNLYYALEVWDLPKDYLCPPVPGRADYIHYIADLLASKNDHIIPTGKQIVCLDIGVGANCIFPIIGVNEYEWNFIGTEIDNVAIANAEKIVILNKKLNKKVSIRKQEEARDIFHDILTKDETIDVVLCNPPFHSSIKEAHKGSKRKVNNLNLSNKGNDLLNFGGKTNELTCEGGEVRFIRNMIHQSKRYAQQCLWFTSIVSKKDHLKDLYKTLRQVDVKEIKTINMAQGSKNSRFIAWTFHTENEQKDWINNRWE